MIRLVSICLFMLIFCSCSSEVVSRTTVVKRYPNAEIVCARHEGADCKS
jgi:hypothetical protein